MKFTNIVLTLATVLAGTCGLTACTEEVDSDSTEVAARDNTSCVGASCNTDNSAPAEVAEMPVGTIYCSDPGTSITCAECRAGGKTPCCAYFWSVGVACEVCDHPPDDKGKNSCTTSLP